MDEGGGGQRTPRTPSTRSSVFGRPSSVIKNMSPITHNKSGKPVSSAQRVLIVNLYKKIQREREGPKVIGKIESAHLISDALGIGVRTIRKVLTEYTTTRTVTSPKRTRVRTSDVWKRLDDFARTVIRRKVHELYRKNDTPTLDKVLQLVNHDETLLDSTGARVQVTRTSLWRVLRKLGFKYAKRQRNAALMERGEIVLWRRKYLREIREHRRQGRTVYYLDETWLNAGHVVGYKWSDTSIKSADQAYREGLTTGLQDPSGKGQRLIILHIGSKNGFVDGGLFTMVSRKTNDYHEEMTAEVFEAWLKDLLPELEEDSVIVLDNAAYHSRQLEKKPNSSWRKDALIEWLQDKGVDANHSLLKVELLALVEQFHCQPIYAVDELITASNRHVLRLPPYHCTLNPIELAWADIKSYAARHNTTFKLADMKELLLDAIAQFTPEKWHNCVEHVIEKVEKEFWEIDNLIEDRLPVSPVIITFSDDSSDDDSFGFAN